MKNFIHILLFVALLLTGCSDKEKLSGKVVFSDGQPLTTGTIYFTTDNYTARAHLRANGTYDVGSLSERDGLPAGTYKVYISGAIENNADPTDETMRLLIAPEFASESKTPLTITVPGERVYNITVERPPPPVKTRR
jgi:hypothetical protein